MVPMIGQFDHAGSESEVSFFCNSPVLFLEQPAKRLSHEAKKRRNSTPRVPPVTGAGWLDATRRVQSIAVLRIKKDQVEVFIIART